MVALPEKIGRYEIQRELGRGMMGVVYEAHDPALTRTVALKTINPSFAASKEDREAFERRFETEARAAGRLSHPNIVVVHDVGRDDDTGVLFIALERLQGEPLSAVISRGERLPWREVLDIGRQIAEALDHLHSQGVVHRDIKPGNVMRLPPVSGREFRPVKLMDFGIAKVDTAQLTAAGQIFGTPLYMAPEQATKESVDARCDIFSLGAVLYALLTGREAFAAENVMATLQRVTNDDPLPPSAIDPAVPRDVDDVLARCLAKDPSHRYLDARHVAEDLADVFEGRPPRHREGWTSPPPRQAAATVAGPLESLLGTLTSTLTADSAAEETRASGGPGPRPRSRWREPGLYVDVAVVGVVMAIAAWVLFRPGGFGDREARADQAPSPSPAAAVAAPAPERPAPSAAPTPGATPTAARPTPRPAPKLAPAQIVVDFRYPLRRGTLRIDMNGKRVLERTIRGEVDKNLLVVKTHEGVHTELLELPAGRHIFDVEVEWDDNVERASIAARFHAGETYRLKIRMGRLRKDLSLEWTR
jgi:serine/threonine protein kinase